MASIEASGIETSKGSMPGSRRGYSEGASRMAQKARALGLGLGDHRVLQQAVLVEGGQRGFQGLAVAADLDQKGERRA